MEERESISNFSSDPCLSVPIRGRKKVALGALGVLGGFFGSVLAKWSANNLPSIGYWFAEPVTFISRPPC